MSKHRRKKPKHRRKKPLIYSTMLTILSVVVVGVYVAAPGVWQWNRAAAQVEAHKIHEVDTAPGPVDEQMVRRLRDTSTGPQGAPVIITYHDIGYNKSKYTVTPQDFATQMRLIHDAGWTTLTAEQLERWLDGEPLPPHSVMVTFDDGARGVWQFADPVLRRFNQHAAAYIITGFVGTHEPYYMTGDEITDLQNSGRWDLEAHTHLGHVQIPSKRRGRAGAVPDHHAVPARSAPGRDH
jgi:hypothetical protein